MRPYAGRDAWFVIRPSALRPSVATQPMHPARHQIVSGCSARAYPPARGHGQGLVSLPELGDHLLGPVPLPVRALHLKLLSATWATKVSRSGWTCSAHPRQVRKATASASGWSNTRRAMSQITGAKRAMCCWCWRVNLRPCWPMAGSSSSRAACPTRWRMMPSRTCRARPRGRGCSSWIEPPAPSERFCSGATACNKRTTRSRAPPSKRSLPSTVEWKVIVS